MNIYDVTLDQIEYFQYFPRLQKNIHHIPFLMKYLYLETLQTGTAVPVFSSNYPSSVFLTGSLHAPPQRTPHKNLVCSLLSFNFSLLGDFSYILQIPLNSFPIIRSTLRCFQHTVARILVILKMLKGMKSLKR